MQCRQEGTRRRRKDALRQQQPTWSLENEVGVADRLCPRLLQSQRLCRRPLTDEPGLGDYEADFFEEGLLLACLEQQFGGALKQRLGDTRREKELQQMRRQRMKTKQIKSRQKGNQNNNETNVMLYLEQRRKRRERERGEDSRDS